jgi:hypothetical protein
MLSELVNCGDEREDRSGDEVRRDTATDAAGEASLAVRDQREASGVAEGTQHREVGGCYRVELERDQSLVW